MTAIELRSELKMLVDRISDTDVLTAMRTLALRTAQQDEQEAEMNRMADLSDEAIAKGEVYTREEVEQWLKEQGAKR